MSNIDLEILIAKLNPLRDPLSKDRWKNWMSYRRKHRMGIGTLTAVEAIAAAQGIDEDEIVSFLQDLSRLLRRLGIKSKVKFT